MSVKSDPTQPAALLDLENVLVLEAGVKSLSEFCAYDVSPVASETTSIPQNPCARSGELSRAAIRSCNGLMAADAVTSGTLGGAASSGAVKTEAIRSATARSRRATDCQRDIAWIVASNKNQFVLE